MTAAPTAAEVVSALRRRSQSIATAESLTGGLVCSALVDVPGASDVVAGGMVAYTAAAKIGVLGVDADLIDRVGTVDPEVAAAMATGVRGLLGATWGVATTGVAGPGPNEGRVAGTVHVAVAGPSGVVTRSLELAGGRRAIREQTVEAALSLVVARVGEESSAVDG